MPTQKKIEIVAKLKESFAGAPAYVFVDYRGLSVSRFTDLRSKLSRLGSTLTVAKNTLIEKATNFKNEGPTAILFAGKEALEAIKVLSDFAKTNPLTIKSGFLEGQTFSGDQILQIAQLPTREILLARIGSGAKSPLYRLVHVLSATQRKLVIVLSGVSKGKN